MSHAVQSQARPGKTAAVARRLAAAGMAGSLWLLPLAYGAGLTPVGLRCDYRAEPLGIDTAGPELSWTLTSAEPGQRGIRQSSFHILVASAPGRLRLGQADLWDSGETASDQMAHVRYAGKALRSGQHCWWSVRVRDQDGGVSDWAEPASWTMGLLVESDWAAKWIAGPGAADKAGPLPLFRREFSLSQPLRRALVFICGLGCYELRVNGARVGDAELDPGWTDYRKHCLYATYDLTGQLHAGTNSLAVMLGNGMYNVPGGRYTKFKGSFGPPKLILQLHLEFADGTTAEVVSDRTWKAAPGPITFTCIYGGEDYDAGRERPGWDQPGFNDGTWAAATEVAGPGGKLVAQSAPPVKVMRELRPVGVTEPRPGVLIYDLGQNFSGRPRLTVEGDAGAVVKLIPGELLNKDGLVEQGWSGGPMWFSYTLKGKGRETWHPRFSYYGFRYVQVEGAVRPGAAARAPGKPTLLELEGEFIHSSAGAVGEFDCSNGLVNRIHRLILGAIDSNLQSVLTDCPHREKLAWLEVSHLLGRAIQFNYDAATLWRKICDDIADAQLANGLVPDIAPEYVVFEGGFRDSPEWGSACVVDPWLVFQYYGDKRILEEHYDSMRRYVEYLGTRATNHIIAYGLGDWCDVGPNVPGESQLTSKGLTATAIYYADVTILERASEVLGKKQAARRWAALTSEVGRAFNERFFQPSLGQYDRGSQTAEAMPLGLGLVEGKERERVVKALVESVSSCSSRVTAGDVGFGFLVEALRGSGRSDVIFDLVTQQSGPGYAMQLAKGATTLTETWDASLYSRNHCMLGHAEEWFYTGLGGIQPDPAGPGFRRSIIAPQPVGDLKWAKASYQSISGRLESAWSIRKGVFELDVTIPPNTEATVWIPAREPEAVREGSQSAREAPGVKFRESRNGAAGFEVGSGHYRFRAPWGKAGTEQVSANPAK